MAKKTRTTSERITNTALVNMCAYVALGLAALLYVVGGILSWLKLGTIVSVLNLIASLALLIAIAIPAWRFARSQKKVWRVLYWCALVIYICGVMFGFIAPLIP